MSKYDILEVYILSCRTASCTPSLNCTAGCLLNSSVKAVVSVYCRAVVQISDTIVPLNFRSVVCVRSFKCYIAWCNSNLFCINTRIDFNSYSAFFACRSACHLCDCCNCVINLCILLVCADFNRCAERNIAENLLKEDILKRCHIAGCKNVFA